MTPFSILQVEDEAQQVSFQQDAFARVGIKNPVHVVTDGHQAIDYLAGRGAYGERDKWPLPGLVLLKLRLPRRPGLEVLQWIRAQASLRSVAVIVLSPDQPASDLERAYEIGANSCILEPADREAWLTLARALRAWWVQLNILAPAHRANWRHAGAGIRASGHAS